MAIIGISGYAGSGKDTVGTLIQMIACKNRVAKISVEEILNDYKNNEWWLEGHSGWEIKKFAGKVKVIASILLGVGVSKFEDREYKIKELGPEWDYNRVEFIEQGVYSSTKQHMTVRDFMQKLATEAMRNRLHEDVWVNALFSDYVPEMYGDDSMRTLPKWIITDVRFLNEAKRIKDNNGIIIRVNRPGIGPVNSHLSEIELDNYSFDYYIDNSKDIDYLSDQVKEIMKDCSFI